MIRSISQFHENERLIAAAQTIGGRCLLWLLATILLAWHEVNVLALMVLSLTLVMLFPGRQRFVLSLAAVGMIFNYTMDKLAIDLHPTLIFSDAFYALPWTSLVNGTTAILVMILLAISVAIHFDKLPAIIRRYPLITLHSALWGGLFLSSLPWLAFLAVAPELAWRLSYLLTLASRGKTQDTRFRDHLFYMVPVSDWSNTATPIGKGLDYLSRHECHDSRSFAVSQLAGIKLLLLALIWTGVQILFNGLVYGQGTEQLGAWTSEWSMNLPRLHKLIADSENTPVLMAWAILYIELIMTTLKFAIWGHVIVGCIRLLGFNIFRNTYKPLLAESVVEFWNRYYFYFKELLVEFFFYPTYLRSSWANPKIRMFLAVFSAAFFGNMYYHILGSPETMLSLDLTALWEQWGPRTVYCLLLAFGIWISMLRQQNSRAHDVKTTFPIKLRRIAGVWTFYSVINIWHVESLKIGIGERFEFFLSLFGA